MKSETLETFFIDLLEQHKFKILRFCTIYANIEDREDLFQEIILNIWRSLPSFRGRSNVTTWLYKIALRVSMRFAQKSAKTRDLHRPLKGLDLTFEAEHDMAQELEKQEEFKRLRSCISALNEVEGLIATLYLEDLNYKEIGEIVGIRDNHVAVKMKRIRAKLLTCIKETI